MYSFASDQDMVGLAIGATVMVSGAQFAMIELYRGLQPKSK